MTSNVYNPCSKGKQTLGSISCITTTFCSLRPIPLNCVPLEYLQDTDSSPETMIPHWNTSYPKYLSPSWDKDTQRVVVWARLQEHCKLANSSPAQVNKCFHALHHKLQPGPVEPSHESLSHDRPTPIPG